MIQIISAFSMTIILDFQTCNEAELLRWRDSQPPVLDATYLQCSCSPLLGIIGHHTRQQKTILCKGSQRIENSCCQSSK